MKRFKDMKMLTKVLSLVLIVVVLLTLPVFMFVLPQVR